MSAFLLRDLVLRRFSYVRRISLHGLLCFCPRAGRSNTWCCGLILSLFIEFPLSAKNLHTIIIRWSGFYSLIFILSLFSSSSLPSSSSIALSLFILHHQASSPCTVSYIHLLSTHTHSLASIHCCIVIFHYHHIALRYHFLVYYLFCWVHRTAEEGVGLLYISSVVFLEIPMKGILGWGIKGITHSYIHRIGVSMCNGFMRLGGFLDSHTKS